MSKKQSQGGFTLTELLIVVVIIGILAALAIPRFMQATTRSMQREAKRVLQEIYEAEKLHIAEKTAYGDISCTAGPGETFHEIGISIPKNARYTYQISERPTADVLATATANLDSDLAEDIWAIDHNGNITNVIDDYFEE